MDYLAEVRIWIRKKTTYLVRQKQPIRTKRI